MKTISVRLTGITSCSLKTSMTYKHDLTEEPSHSNTVLLPADLQQQQAQRLQFGSDVLQTRTCSAVSVFLIHLPV